MNAGMEGVAGHLEIMGLDYVISGEFLIFMRDDMMYYSYYIVCWIQNEISK